MSDIIPISGDRLRAMGLRALGDSPAPEAREAFLRRWAGSLGDLDQLQVQLERDELKRAGFRVALIAAAVAAAATPRAEEPGQGGSLRIEDPTPWPDPVDGGDLLGEIRATLRKHLALPAQADIAISLWVILAHAHDALQISPILAITSPEKQCGKTTLLDLLSGIVPRPIPAANLTPAVTFRVIEAHHPTLLIDEADTFIRHNDELRGVLNSSHRRGMAFVPRCVGDEHEPRLFSTWCPKAIGLIGTLPDTLTDRAIVVPMRRRLPGEEIEALRVDRLHSLGTTREKAWRWAQDNIAAIRVADPSLPSELHNRAADNWRALVAIADLAGGEWPDLARVAAVKLTRGDQDEGSARAMILSDIRDIFDERGADRVSSADVVEDLVKLEHRPWPEWRRGQPLSTRSLAKLLGPFEISPQALWVDGKTRRAYTREAFEDAWGRYTPLSDPQGRKEPLNHAGSGHIPKCKAPSDPYTSKSGVNPRGSGVPYDLTLGKGGVAGNTENQPVEMGPDSASGNVSDVLDRAVLALDLVPVTDSGDSATVPQINLLRTVCAEVSPKAVAWAEDQIGRGLTESQLYELVAVVNERKRKLEASA